MATSRTNKRTVIAAGGNTASIMFKISPAFKKVAVKMATREGVSLSHLIRCALAKETAYRGKL